MFDYKSLFVFQFGCWGTQSAQGVFPGVVRRFPRDAHLFVLLIDEQTGLEQMVAAKMAPNFFSVMCVGRLSTG
jgi:hypothetical protein